MMPRLRRSPASSAGAPRRAARSRTESAGEVVRLEYERARITTEIAQLTSRLEAARQTLARIDGRIGDLHEALRLDGGSAAAPAEGAPAPPMVVVKVETITRGAKDAHARHRR
jgi:hypothetical protein